MELDGRATAVECSAFRIARAVAPVSLGGEMGEEQTDGEQHVSQRQ